jgi:hypothetical protein
MTLCEKCGAISYYDHYFHNYICSSCRHKQSEHSPNPELDIDSSASRLKTIIPPDELQEILNQPKCELDYSFLGFVNNYEALSCIIPLHYTIIDFGCYTAAQSYFFKDHAKYIGVDTCTLKRCAPPNSVHYYEDIDSFLQYRLKDIDLKTTFAIMNYVNDSEACTRVREIFANCFQFYPSNPPIHVYFSTKKEVRP